MGDLDFIVRIKTEHPDPATLMEAFGRAVAQGCFRVPAKLAAGRPFVLIFLTRAGAAAIKGTAEVVRQEEDATWVRFLSASDPRRDADIVLTHVKVTIVPSTVVISQGAPHAAPQAAHHASRDPRTATPLRSLPAISLPPENAPPSSQADAPAQPERGKAIKPPVERASERPSHPLVEQATERTSERAIDRSADRPPERPSDRVIARSGDGSDGSAQAITARISRAARRSAQHPVVRLVDPKGSRDSASIPSIPAMRMVTPLSSKGDHSDGAPDMVHAASAASVDPSVDQGGLADPVLHGAPLPPPRHLADPGYPRMVRTRGPSRQPRGLPVMPALSVDSDEGKRPGPLPPPQLHHAGHLADVPMSSTTAPLPELPMSSTTAPLPAGPRPPQDARVTETGRTEVSAVLPLVSVVPWWTNPPEQAPPRPPTNDSSASRILHTSAEAAVDFVEASAPDLARPRELRAPYPRPPTMAEYAADPTTGTARALERDERDAREASGTGAARPGAWPGSDARPTQWSGVQPIPQPAPEPLARRVLWGSIAIAFVCAVVAIGAVGWALEMRASAYASRGQGSASTTSLATRPPGRALASQPVPWDSSAPHPTPPTPATTPAVTTASATGPAAEGPAAASGCQLRISASANPATIEIDGVARGETPALVDVPCRPVHVELRRARYAAAERTVEPGPGVTEVELRLSRPVVAVRILSRPAGATVRLNGKDLGKTPLTAQVTAYEHATLIWIAPDGATRTQQIYPQAEGDSFSAIMGR
jgi:PEGA domain